jgi:hypothetical protein
LYFIKMKIKSRNVIHFFFLLFSAFP